jgi:hypothetical protein
MEVLKHNMGKLRMDVRNQSKDRESLCKHRINEVKLSKLPEILQNTFPAMHRTQSSEGTLNDNTTKENEGTDKKQLIQLQQAEVMSNTESEGTKPPNGDCPPLQAEVNKTGTEGGITSLTAMKVKFTDHVCGRKLMHTVHISSLCY